ncbi:protein kinase domain-containing protein [Streptomyces sp. 4N509B]|uniref:protein kinase domain-containing protein n=1 Tax=Streptomyces sp. 4N509B TaxID=3457413 RepID=UPI003FD369BA
MHTADGHLTHGTGRPTGPPTHEPLAPDDPRAVGRYPLAARLGSGGMGRVYLAHTPGGRPVAIKVVRPELAEDPQFRLRFRREVEAAGRVQGLYTAPVVDADTEGATPWLATAYVPGPSLAEAVARHGALPEPTALLLLAGVAEALQAIHGAGLVHRDLKPSNVLLAADGPRVIDFGIARAVEGTSLTGSGVVVGTPSFMSPEQAAGREVGPATDVFALGQLAVFVATGAPAFGEGTSHAVLYRIVHEHPDLSVLPAGPLAEVVAHCLAKDPALRPGPGEIVARCRAALPATGLPAPGQWLPPAVTAELAGGPSGPAGPSMPPPGGPPGPTPRQPPTPVTAPDGPPGPTRRATPAGARRGVVVAAASAAALLVVGVAVAALSLGDDGEPTARRGPLDTTAGETTGGGASPGRQAPDGPAPRETTPETTPGATASREPTPRDPVEPPSDTYTGLDIPAGYHLHLGSDPLAARASGTWNMTEIDFRYFTGGDPALLRTAEGNELVSLPAGRPGSFAACVAETTRAGAVTEVSLDDVAVGSQLCVRTAAGHLALVTLTGTPDTGRGDHVTVDATVWRRAL